MRGFLVVVIAAAAGLVGCGGGGGSQATCSPHGSHLQISARSSAFSTSCLAAPANTPFTIAFHNEDANTPHSVEVLSGSGGVLFRGAIFPGVKSVTYHLPS